MSCPGATCRPQLLQHLLLSLRVSLGRLVVVDCVVVILVQEVHGLVDGCVWAESFAGRRGVHLREICRKFMWDVLICSPCCPDICCRCILWPSCRSWSGGCHSARSRPSSPGWWRAAEESDGRWRDVSWTTHLLCLMAMALVCCAWGRLGVRAVRAEFHPIKISRDWLVCWQMKVLRGFSYL